MLEGSCSEFSNELLGFWSRLLCLANRNLNKRGVIDKSSDVICSVCRIDEKRYKKLIWELKEQEMIVEDEQGRLVIVNWNKYQEEQTLEQKIAAAEKIKRQQNAINYSINNPSKGRVGKVIHNDMLNTPEGEVSISKKIVEQELSEKRRKVDKITGVITYEENE